MWRRCTSCRYSSAAGCHTQFACSGIRTYFPCTAAVPRDLDIVTLLEFDAIKAIDNPEFLSPEEVGDTYRPNEKVIGVSIDGDSRAYSVPMLSRHEIVNDTVGGVKIAVTW